MRRIKEMLRLRSLGQVSYRQIAKALGIARSTVATHLGRAEALGLSWPLPEDLDDAALEALLFPEAPPTPEDRALPDFVHIHQELRRKGVTRMLLWQEYKAASPDGLSYSRFCELYQHWGGQLDPVMRQHHPAGERLFVDYAGMTVPIVDGATGEVFQAQIFVATLGASSYTYAEATRSQMITDWVGSHVRAFAFFGGVPEIIVPDNLKSGVTSAHRYDPEINRTYAEMAEHYGVAVLPARSARPRDKGKVESGVQIVERRVLAPLRDRTFFSLEELNAAIAPLLAALNDRPFAKKAGTRRALFENLDRPALKALPQQPYVLAEWKKVRVNIDYHIEVDHHYYSVPFRYLRAQLDVRLTASSIECFDGTQRIASHLRSRTRGGHSTVREHMPEKHRQYAEWSPERITQWGRSVGPSTAELLERIIAARAHPQQGYRTCLGILRMTKLYGEPVLERAAAYAIGVGALSYKSIESILKHRRYENVPLELPIEAGAITHENLRGRDYYRHQEESSAYHSND